MWSLDNCGAPISKRGVAQAIAERIQRRGGIEQIAAVGAGLEVVEHRQLADGRGDGHRQFAAGIDIAEQHIRHGVAALLAQIPAFDQRIRLRRELTTGRRPPIDQHHDHGLAERVYGIEEVVLLAHQIQAVAIAQMVVGPAFAAGLLGIADGENDLIGASCAHVHRLLDEPRDFPPDRRACTSSAHQSSLAVIFTPRRKTTLTCCRPWRGCRRASTPSGAAGRSSRRAGPPRHSGRSPHQRLYAARRGERQDAVVLQQHRCCARGFQRERARLRITGERFGVLAHRR